MKARSQTRSLTRRHLRRGYLASLGPAFLLACAQPSSAPQESGDARAPEISPECVQSADLLEKARDLYSRGKLARTLNTLDKARQLCAANAGFGWDLQLRVLAELGSFQKAKQFSGLILGLSESIPLGLSELRQQAHDVLDGKVLPPRPVNPQNGAELVSAGLEARKKGDAAPAQKLLDRAILLLEQEEKQSLGLDIRNGEGGSAFISYSSELESVAISPDGLRIAAGCKDKTIRLWEFQPSGAPSLKTWKEHHVPVDSLAFSPDGTQLASAAGDDLIRLWDIRTGKVVRKIGDPDLSPRVSDLAFSPDGKRLAGSLTRPRDVIVFWDPATGKVEQEFTGHTNTIYALAFSPDGKKLISGDADRIVRQWDTASAESLMRVKEHTEWVTDVAYAANGKFIASSGWDHRVVLMDAESGSVRRVLEGFQHLVLTLAISKDSKFVAAAGTEDTVRVWESSSGKEVAKVSPEKGTINALVFSPDGQYLISAADHGGLWFYRSPAFQAGLVMRAIEGADAGYIAAGQHIEFAGSEACAARAKVRCRVGSQVFPFELCEERAYSPGVGARFRAGDKIEPEPEMEAELLKCPEP